MAKRIEADGKVYRVRRGKLVEIPAEWVGRTVHAKTIRARPSKAPHKHRKELRRGPPQYLWGHKRGHPRTRVAPEAMEE